MPSAKRTVRRDIRRLKRVGFSPYTAAVATLRAAEQVKRIAVFYGIEDLDWPEALIDEAGIQVMHTRPDVCKKEGNPYG